MAGTMSFDLTEYDRAYDVIEVKFYAIGKELQPSPENNNSPETPPPPQGAFLPDYYLIEGIVSESYKGLLPTGGTQFHTSESGGACGWYPEIGLTYLIYLHEPNQLKGENIHRLNLCQRRLRTSEKFNERYDQERCILEDLRDKKDGVIEPRQKFTGRGKDSVWVIPFSGAFKNGKRTGDWTIYQPFVWRDSGPKIKQPVLVLSYEEGKLYDLKSDFGNGKRRLSYGLRGIWQYRAKRKLE